jgi:hypothetical protein
VTSPQPQKGRLSRTWSPSTIRTILRNERYTGKIVWSRKHKVRDPRTGPRVYRAREGEVPIRGVDQPESRIVSDKPWSAVVERRELVKRIYEEAGKRPALLRSSAMNAPYVFSGLLKCALCGANLQIVAGRGRNHPNQTHGCPLNFHRGDSVCSNRTRVQRDVQESKLIFGLQSKVLREDVVNFALDRLEEQLERELGISGARWIG